MAFVMFSDYACVESGSVLSDGEDRLVYQTRKEALAKYQDRRDVLLRAVEYEIGIFKQSDVLEFNSPYIVWIILLNLPDCECTLEAVDAYLSECVAADDHPEKHFKRQVEKYDGWVFSEEGRTEHAVGEVIDGLVDYYY